jgi:60 kDa SS-A/Ro ribonucleoprotein
MAKFNSKSKATGISKTTKGITVNHEGEKAYELKDKERLVTGVLTCFVNEPKFYKDTTPDIIKTARALAKTDPDFVAKLAVYTRKEFHMRTISQVLVAELAKNAQGSSAVRKAVRGVIERPDDMIGLIAYHLDTWGPRKKNNPIPRSMRRGIADAFPKFDEYQLGKYKALSQEVKLRDVLLIARPKPETEEQAVLWKKLIENTLEVPETRETILSEKGQSKEVWEEFIDGGKMGYMAMLRNLKNMLDNKISDNHLAKVILKLADPVQIKKSKQLPFRFFTAYKMLETQCNGTRTGLVLDALAEAIKHSFENLPPFEGTTAVICDESGSMTWSGPSKESIIKMIDIGNLLGAGLSAYTKKGIAIPFGDTAKIVHLSKTSNIFDNMSKLVNSGVGHSTHLIAALNQIDKLDTSVDRIVVFTDCECYGGDVQRWANAYRAKVNPNLWIHTIDLQGHGTTQFIGEKTNIVAGWSEKVLDLIYQVENGGKDLIKKIEQYEI